MDVEILVTDDDIGHVDLIKRNFKRVGIINHLKHFFDGQELLDFFYDKKNNIIVDRDRSYLILLDIRMPKVDGIDVLRKLKSDENLKRIPVIMLTTTDDPYEVKLCYQLGCNNYITKPINYDDFVDVIKKLGLFLNVVSVPSIK